MISSSIITSAIQRSQKEGKKRTENLFEELIAEHFSNLEKETDIWIQEALRSPHKISSRRCTRRHIMIKIAKSNDREF